MNPRRTGSARIALGVFLAVAVAGAVFAVGARQELAFPHERHQRLFPLCTGCHEGIPSGEASAFYPSPESCTRCHNGEDQERVSWDGPAPRVDNLRFTHDGHAELLEREGDPEQTCQACHVPPGGGRMAVSAEIQLPTCLSCHGHRAEEHRVDAACSTCSFVASWG